ncbi:NfeD family protein [Mesorhizobium sp. CAU 1741]|uniref:NfeD family protein n=1 Tax=Mesorhizobium sp. CAU 1741 TaxID=3140366 RepID=UPI00325B4081
MFSQWLSDLGPWSWMVLGAVLLVLEILAPGVFFLWFGVAAILTGTLSFQLWETSFWIWQTQVVVFLVLSVGSALVGRRFFPNNTSDDTDTPLLNQRTRQLVGRTAVLEEPILEGQGRIRLGDTLWRVTGPDLPAGARVRVIDAAGGDLKVAAE